MAAAMVGVAPQTAGAKMTLQKAMQLRSEGKAKKPVLPLRSKARPMNGLKTQPVSQFHKVMERKDAAQRKAPARITPYGDNIYGFLGFSMDEFQTIGLYEFDETQATLKWADEVYYEEELVPRAYGLHDGIVKGYSIFEYMGYLLGSYYAEYDFESGELIDFKENDTFEDTFSYLSTAALNTDEGVFFGYGSYDDELCFMSAPADDPFNYTYIAPADNETSCISMCYNPTDGSLYGVTRSYDFVKIAANGNQEALMHLDVPAGAHYMTGLVFDPASGLFYWNINTEYDEAMMATIDPASLTLDIYDELINGEEYVSLFTTDANLNPLQPLRPEAAKPEFLKGSLSGSVDFSMPSELAGGSPIEGSLKYKAFVDGNIYTSGEAKPGETVKIGFTVEQGLHSFSLTVEYDGVESSPASVSTYVGNDTPMAPSDVVLDDDKVSWTAVTAGVHDGYVDADAITYTVLLNGMEIGTTSTTSMAIDLPKDTELTKYVAEVFAECNGLVSDPAFSDAIVEGAALKIPQLIMPTPEQFELCTIVDNNGDGANWALYEVYGEEGSYCLRSGFTIGDGNPMDDWLFLPRMAFDETDRFYSLSIETALYNSMYNKESIEVLLCSQPSPEAVVLPAIIDEFSPAATTFNTRKAIFKVSQPGEYYVALHCTSAADQFGMKVRNINVEATNITEASPAAVEGLKAEETTPGTLEAKVTFTMPTQTIGGEAIPADAVLTAYVSATTEVALTGRPGEELTTVMPTVQGNNEVTVYVSYGGYDSPAASTIVFTGFDIPAVVDEVTAEVSADMLSMTLNWTPATVGENGGYILPEDILYDIYVLTDYGYEYFDGGIKGTTFTYSLEPGTPQEYVQLGVMSTNAAGNNGMIVTASGIMGTPYSIPVEEDFDNDERPYSLNPWVIYGNRALTQWSIYHTSGIDEKYEGMETNCLVAQGYQGGQSMIGMPRITTAGCDGVVVTLDVSGDFSLPKATLKAAAYGKDPVVIGHIEVSGPGFQKVSIPLPEEFLDQYWVGLFIDAEFESDDELLVIESISIDRGSRVATVAHDGVKVAGSKDAVLVSGMDGGDVTVATLDGRVVAFSSKVSGEASFKVDKGIYVVTASGTIAKVVVK